MPRKHLRLEDLSDREFLLILADVVHDSGEGWADSQIVADKLDLESRRLASSRLSWLARWGAVEREHARDEHGNMRYHRDGKVMYTQRWRLTAAGWQMASGEMRKGVQNALNRADDGQMLAITHWLATRSTNATATKLIQREWQREQLLRR